MAQRLVKEGAEVLLGMSCSKKLRALLPPEVKGKKYCQPLIDCEPYVKNDYISHLIFFSNLSGVVLSK